MLCFSVSFVSFTNVLCDFVVNGKVPKTTFLPAIHAIYIVNGTVPNTAILCAICAIHNFIETADFGKLTLMRVRQFYAWKIAKERLHWLIPLRPRRGWGTC